MTVERWRTRFEELLAEAGADADLGACELEALLRWLSAEANLLLFVGER